MEGCLLPSSTYIGLHLSVLKIAYIIIIILTIKTKQVDKRNDEIRDLRGRGRQIEQRKKWKKGRGGIPKRNDVNLPTSPSEGVSAKDVLV